MSRQYHALAAPHGSDRLTLPSSDENLRAFFTMCMERHEFQTAGSEREQVHLCSTWGQNLAKKVSMQQLADFFEVPKSTIAYHLSRPFDIFTGCTPGQPGRPSFFTPEQLKEIECFIRERFELRMPVSYEELREFSEEQWGLIPNISTLRNIINDSTSVRTVTGKPMEDHRIFASREAIDRYFDDLNELITTAQIPAAFVINIDESGFDQFADARQTTRIVPTEYRLNSIPVPITRAEKRATLIAAICADGTALRPLVVVQRETIEQELLLRGYTLDKVQLARSDTGYVNKELFIQWAKRSLFPQMQQRRLELDYLGPILIILDGFGCHQSPEFQELAESENIVLRFIPPHSSDQVQPLDLGIFSNQKRWQNNISVEAQLNRQTKQVIKIVDSYRMATTFKNVVSSFRRAGIVTWLDETTLTLMVRVDKSYATAVRDVYDEETRELPGDKERIAIE